MSIQQQSPATKAMLVICAFGLSSFIAVAVAAPALDKTFDNQDSLVQQAKWRNSGYFDDDNGIELNISEDSFANANKHANDFLANNRESLNQQPSSKDNHESE